MYDPVTGKVKRVFMWLERLDRWGYVWVGISFLAIGMFLFLIGWISFARHVREDSAFIMVAFRAADQGCAGVRSHA